MSNVIVPQSKEKRDTLGTALTVASIVPGPQQPFAAGGNALLGLSKKPKEATPVVQSDTGAMQRRMEGMQASQNNIRALREADAALASVPPEQAQQYAPAIKRARQLAETEYA